MAVEVQNYPFQKTPVNGRTVNCGMERARTKAASAKVVSQDRADTWQRKAVEKTLVGMALIDLEGRLVQANDAFHDIVGCARGEGPGRDIKSLMVGADAASVLRIIYLASGESDDNRAECQLIRGDGVTVWVSARACLLKADRPGEPAHISVQIIDIDGQKRAEAAVAYSESRLAYALESAGQGVWDYDLRTDQMYYSRMWRFMRGIPLDEPIDPGMEVWLTRVHPDDVPRVRAAAPKQAFGEHEYNTIEYRERHRDGHYVWILSRGRPVEWGANGIAVRTIGTDTDITRLKLAEEELAAEKERLRVTLESIGDGVISTDAAGRVTFMNTIAAMMTDWNPADAAGRTLEQVFSVFEEESGRAAASPVARCLAEGKLVCLDSNLVLIGRDNERRDVRATAAPLQMPDGRIIGAVLVFQDVTTSRKLQKELAHSATPRRPDRAAQSARL
ncbi:MAG: PAS domain S-box protein [Bauldia sp.]